MHDIGGVDEKGPGLIPGASEPAGTESRPGIASPPRGYRPDGTSHWPCTHPSPKKSVSGPVKRSFTALLIVLAASACDNVEWGGVQLQMESPDGPVDSVQAELDSLVVAEPAGPVLPEGYTLFAASRGEGDRVTIRPIAEVQPDTLLPLPLNRDQPGFWDVFVEARMKPGTALTLFAEGVRAGTARIQSVDFQPGLCAPAPVAEAVLELLPAAAGASRFVALLEGTGLPQEYREFLPREHTYDQRVAGLALATEAISRASAPWPGSVLETRADMHAFALDGDRDGAFAATFLFQDALRVGRPLTSSAYGIFVLGTGGPIDYDLAYMDYRPVQNGKAATRFFEQGDWDGDGEAEILLEVFGEETQWMAALDRRNGRWVRVFEERCEPGAPAA